MPRRSPAARQEYEERRRQLRQSPEYRAQVNARRRQRYAEDLEYRKRVRAYHKEYRTLGRVNLSTKRARSNRLVWTQEQEDHFLTLTQCEVCGKSPKTLHADHCHDCGQYRGALCSSCNTGEGHLRKWRAVCPEGSPMRLYMDRHVCQA